ncbi:MAG: protein kinase, partial [Myxococcota bacterium]|nr:protein kinase [Myxococcota bacterium]
MIGGVGLGLVLLGLLGRVPVMEAQGPEGLEPVFSMWASTAGWVAGLEWPSSEWSTVLTDRGWPKPMGSDLMLGVGVLFLFLAFVLFKRRPFREGAVSAPEGAGSAGRDRKARRRSRRQVRLLAGRGELEAAAELCWEMGDFDSAVNHFVEAGLKTRAADVLQDQARNVEAAALLAEAGEFDRAAVLYGREEAWEQAGRCYSEMGRPGQAAEMYEKGGQLHDSALSYEKAEFFMEAARVWSAISEWGRSARCLERVLAESRLRSQSGPSSSQVGQDLAKRIVELHDRDGHPDRGLAALEQAGCWREVAELALKLGDDTRAAHAFQEAGDPLRSAEILQRLGKGKTAARQLADHHRDQEELGEAAQCLEGVGDYAEAGDLYRQQGEFLQAAECYRNQGDWLAAAEMFESAGQGPAAAECYEKAGDFEQAAGCHLRLEQMDRAAENLERAGLRLEAGRAFCSISREDEAVAALQGLRPEDPDFMEGTALLAELFCKREQPELAIHALEAAIGESEIDRDNLVAYYALARALERVAQWRRCVELFEKILSLDIGYRDVARRLDAAREEVVRLPRGAGPEDSSEDAAPTNANRYHIRGELGRGGMGIVYEAFDTVLDRKVAFKVLPGHLTSSGQDSGHFLREAKAAAKLNHPNIVTVYDAGSQGGRLYIAMEHVDGITFKQILGRRGALAARGMLYVALQLCEALAYAHTQKVVHRDIKPANIMWTRDKNTKIMDFGLAKSMEEVLQQTTAVAGTPYYMSPEQTLGRNVDHRTDIYALGVTLFEMLTGRVPFKDGDISYHHVHTPAPDVREYLPDAPESIARLISRCLHKDPHSRFQTAEE